MVRVTVLADHGAFNGMAQPSKFLAGFFSVFTGSYDDLEAAHCQVTGVYTNKESPGGVAYSCSFRVSEAVYLVERMVDLLAPGARAWTRLERWLRNLLRPEQFPYTRDTGWVYDSGDYPRTLRPGHGTGGVRRAEEGAGSRTSDQQAHAHRGELLHRGGSCGARASTWTSSASAWPTG